MARHIGGSLLPSGSPEVYAPKTGQHGTFETRPLPELNTHGLFYARAAGDYAGHFILVASHPNGYSCDALAKRILDAWSGADTPSRALSQLDHILACGGMSMSRERLEWLVDGKL